MINEQRVKRLVRLIRFLVGLVVVLPWILLIILCIQMFRLSDNIDSLVRQQALSSGYSLVQTAPGDYIAAGIAD